MADPNDLGSAVLSLRTDDRGLTRGLAGARKQTAGLDKDFKQATASLKRLYQLLVAGVATKALISFSKASAQAALSVRAIERAMAAAVGSAEKAGEEFDFVRRVADELGLNLETAAQGYTKIAAAARFAGFTTAEARDVFESVSIAARAMNLSTDQLNGALVALEQIMSKGKLSAEELRRQLAQRIPGAFGLAAQAIGVTTEELDKMIAAGEVSARDVLVPLADVLKNEFGPAAKDAAEGAGAAFARLETALFNFRSEVGEELLPALQGIAVALNELIETAGEDGAKIIGETLAQAIVTLAGTFTLAAEGAIKTAAAIQTMRAAVALGGAEFRAEQREIAEGLREFGEDLETTRVALQGVSIALSDDIPFAIVEAAIAVKDGTASLEQLQIWFKYATEGAEGFGDEAETAAQKIAKFGLEVNEILADAGVAGEGIRKFGNTFVELSEDAEKLIETLRGSREELVANSDALVEAFEALRDSGNLTRGVAEEIGDAAIELVESWVKFGEKAPAAVLKLAEALGPLGDEAEALKEKIKELREEEEKLAKEFDEATAAVERQRKAFNDAEKSVDDLKKERDELRDATFTDPADFARIDELNELIADGEEAWRDQRNELDLLELELDGVERAFGGVGDEIGNLEDNLDDVGNLGRSFDEFGRAVDRAGGGLGDFSGGIDEAGLAMEHGAEAAREFVDRIEDLERTRAVVGDMARLMKDFGDATRSATQWAKQLKECLDSLEL